MSGVLSLLRRQKVIEGFYREVLSKLRCEGQSSSAGKGGSAAADVRRAATEVCSAWEIPTEKGVAKRTQNTQRKQRH